MYERDQPDEDYSNGTESFEREEHETNYEYNNEDENEYDESLPLNNEHTQRQNISKPKQMEQSQKKKDGHKRNSRRRNDPQLQIKPVPLDKHVSTPSLINNQNTSGYEIGNRC